MNVVIAIKERTSTVKKFFIYGVLISGLLLTLFGATAATNTPTAHAATLAHPACPSGATGKASPRCSYCLAAQTRNFSHGFNWDSGVFHEQIDASYYYDGKCNAPVLLDKHCDRDTYGPGATSVSCTSYLGDGGRVYVNGVISGTVVGISKSADAWIYSDPSGILSWGQSSSQM